MMGGAYQMKSESGEQFDIEIPTFSLDRPNQGVLLN
jgi:ApaG protein